MLGVWMLGVWTISMRMLPRQMRDTLTRPAIDTNKGREAGKFLRK